MVSESTAMAGRAKAGYKGTSRTQQTLEVLRRVAPGTELREALDNVISADGGALIVIGDTPAVTKLCDGGFTVFISTPDEPRTMPPIADTMRMSYAAW